MKSKNVRGIPVFVFDFWTELDEAVEFRDLNSCDLPLVIMHGDIDVEKIDENGNYQAELWVVPVDKVSFLEEAGYEVVDF